LTPNEAAACYDVIMSASDRRLRAQGRRSRASLSKARLRPTEEDLTPVRGPEAISLACRLTVESWSLSGRPEPTYKRQQIPCRFVPGRLT
jgi:hypothetical protein